MMMDYNSWGYGNERGVGVIGLAFMFCMMLLVVAVIVIIARHISAKSVTIHHHETALDLLGKRYARGEIEKKEYEEKRKALGGSGS
jgi:putative membrane protein